MIGRFKLHAGGPKLAAHLANAEMNSRIVVTAPCLRNTAIDDAIRELSRMAIGCGVLKPLIHAFASPSIGYSEDAWERYWDRFEEEFDLVGQPYLSVQHAKLGHGRVADHEHRVYVRIRGDRTAIRASFSAIRMEKLSRVAEVDNGELLVAGRHNRAIIDRLREEGRSDVSDAMVAARLHLVARPQAVSAKERAQAERLQDLSPSEVRSRAWNAWSSTSDGPSLVRALIDNGLWIAMGDAGIPVLVTAKGVPHRMTATIASGAKAAGLDERVRKRDTDARLTGVEIRPLAEVRAGLVPEEVPTLLRITGLDRDTPAAVEMVEPSPIRDEPAMPTGRAVDERPAAAGRMEIEAPEIDLSDEAIRLGEDFMNSLMRLGTSAPEAEVEDKLDEGPALGPTRKAPLPATSPTKEASRPRLIVERTPEAPKPRPSGETDRSSILPPSREAARHLHRIPSTGRLTREEFEAMVLALDRAEHERRTSSARAALKPPTWNLYALAGHTARVGKLAAVKAPVSAIGPVGSKAAFKARLAGVRPDTAGMIRWVETEQPGYRTILLRSGTTLRAEPNLITTDGEDEAAIRTMISHAVEQGWGTIEVFGGTAAWRVAMAEEAARQGLKLANPEFAYLNPFDIGSQEHRDHLTDRELEDALDVATSPVWPS